MDGICTLDLPLIELCTCSAQMHDNLLKNSGKPMQSKLIGRAAGISIVDPDAIKHILNDNFEGYEKVGTR